MSNLKLASSFLDIGETSYNIACPKCRHKGSFSVTRTEKGILYNCFRLKCGIKGFIPLSESSTRKRRTEEKEDRSKYFEFVSLPFKVKLYLKRRFHITEQQIEYNNIKWCTTNERVLFPLYSKDKSQFGVLLRSYKQGIRTKAVVYTTTKTKKLYYPLTGKNNDNSPVLLVEDVLSAIRASELVNTAALLGTSLSRENAIELINKEIIIALDNDATLKAIKIKRKYGGLFKSCKVVILPKDIKNMTNNQLEIFMDNIMYGE